MTHHSKLSIVGRRNRDSLVHDLKWAVLMTAGTLMSFATLL